MSTIFYSKGGCAGGDDDIGPGPDDDGGDATPLPPGADGADGEPPEGMLIPTICVAGGGGDDEVS